MTNANPDREGLDLARKREFPMLDWLCYDNNQQAITGYGYLNENGKLSQIWTRSPLTHNEDIPGNKSFHTDGCSFGLTNQDEIPLLKSYRLDSNLKLHKSVKRCPGHGDVKHGEISGRTTASTTVYTSKLAKALVADIHSFAKKFAASAGLVPVKQPKEALCSRVNTAGIATPFWLTRVYASTIVPEASTGSRPGLLLRAAADITLQRNEWNAVYFGIQFRGPQLMAGAVEILLPEIEIRDGLSLFGDTVFLNNDKEFALVLWNTGSTITLNTSDPIIKLTVDAADTCVYLHSFWSCPKCKHGGRIVNTTTHQGNVDMRRRQLRRSHLHGMQDWNLWLMQEWLLLQ